MPQFAGEEMQKSNHGIGYALAAYGLWGIYPLFWKHLEHVPALQIICHRLIWSLFFVAGLVLWRGQMGEVRQVLRQPKLVLTLLASALLLTSNWLVYVWAVNTGQIVETSMGYFINPLVSVVLGLIFLKEKISLRQGAAVALAAVGVGYMVIRYGKLPWVALFLAFSFGFYGLIRKVVPVGSLTGLLLETALLSPLVAAYLFYAGAAGQSAFLSHGPLTTILLMVSGVITAFPLIWLVLASKQLPLKTLGFCQYLAPSLMLVIGVLVYHEPFTADHRISFSLIWAALMIYSWSLIGKSRSRGTEPQTNGSSPDS